VILSDTKLPQAVRQAGNVSGLPIFGMIERHQRSITPNRSTRRDAMTDFGKYRPISLHHATTPFNKTKGNP
jgi:hypothetical protein